MNAFPFQLVSMAGRPSLTVLRSANAVPGRRDKRTQIVASAATKTGMEIVAKVKAADHWPDFASHPIYQDAYQAP
jgi:hypothetical protein